MHLETAEVKFKKGRKIDRKTLTLLITPSTHTSRLAVKKWAELEPYEYDSFTIESVEPKDWSEYE